MEIASANQNLGAQQLKISQQQDQQAVELATQAASQAEASSVEAQSPSSAEGLGQNLAVYA